MGLFIGRLRPDVWEHSDKILLILRDQFYCCFEFWTRLVIPRSATSMFGRAWTYFFSMRLSTRVKAGVEGVQVVSGWISVRCMREFQSKNPSWSRGAEDWEALVTKDANVDACLGGWGRSRTKIIQERIVLNGFEKVPVVLVSEPKRVKDVPRTPSGDYQTWISRSGASLCYAWDHCKATAYITGSSAFWPACPTNLICG